MRSNTARIRDGIRDDTADTRMIVDLTLDLDEAVVALERERARRKADVAAVQLISDNWRQRAEAAEAALAEYKEDLQRWHARVEAAESERDTRAQERQNVLDAMHRHRERAEAAEAERDQWKSRWEASDRYAAAVERELHQVRDLQEQG